MSKKKLPESKPELILSYRETKSGGRAIDPSDRWTSHEPEYIEWYADKVYIDEPTKKARDKCTQWCVESLNYRDLKISVGDLVYIVVVRYQTGCTFGTTHGAWHIECIVKTAEEAFKIKEDIEEDNKNYLEYRRSYNPKKQLEEKYESADGYKCWQGYFEALEDVEIKICKVE